MDRYYHYKSPFVFNEPYTIDKKEAFFGRQKTIEEISIFFNRTNLLTIYGPVGSGKSSIAQCGLSKVFLDWNPHTIYRNGNFIQSFELCLTNEINGINIKIVEEFFKNIHEYRREQRKIDSLNSNINQYYKKIRLNEEREETSKERDIFTRNRNNLSKFKGKQKELLDKIHGNIEELHMSCPYKPVFVFDQFEDLFIEDDKEEIELMKIVLSVLKKSIEFCKIILCIQDDLFSHLMEFHKHIPNMFNDSVVVNYVSTEDLFDIILKNFEHYNINQVYVPDNESDNQQYSGIPKKDRKNRVDLIIEHLKKNEKVHLPFLQLYLNRLYVEDFARTYPKSIEDLREIRDQKYYQNKPLEFTEGEILAYGNIEKVLGTYLKEVNDRLIEKENQITSDRGYKDVTLRFLKYFVNENGTSKSLKIGLTVDSRKNRESEKFLNLKDEDLKNEIKMDMWKSTDSEIEQSIGDLIKELRLARILVKRKYYVELSHNLLASVIRDIPIKEEIVDYVNYYGREFNASFETFKRREQDKKGKLFFLRNTPSNRVIKIVDKNLDSIIAPNDIERKAKISFLRKAKNTLTLRIVLLSIFGILLTYIAFRAYIEINDLGSKARRNTAILTVTRNILDSINMTTAVGEYDATKAFKKIMALRREVDSSSLVSLKDFSSITGKFHHYVSNYTGNPFYSSSINLSKHPFIKNKNITNFKLPNLWDSWDKSLKQTAYFLNERNLFSVDLDMKGLKSEAPRLVQSKSDENKITSFEPFFMTTERQAVIISETKRIKIISNNDLRTIAIDSTDRRLRSLSSIEYLRDAGNVKVFVGIKRSGNKKDRLIKIINQDKAISGRDISLSNFYLEKKREDSLIHKEKVKDVELKYLIRKDRDTICFIAALNQQPYIVKLQVGRSRDGEDDSILDTLNLKRISEKISIDDITAFSGNETKNMGFIAIENIVYQISLDEFFVRGKQYRPAVVLPAGSKVTSISTFENTLLLGSENKRAYLYSFNESNTKIIGSTHILKKELRGHAETVNSALLVPTRDKKKLKTVSVGADGRLLLWDFESTEVSENKIPMGLDIFDLKYASINGENTLLIGFNYIDPTKAGNLLFRFDDKLNKIKPLKYSRVKNSNLNSIDVDDEGSIFVGTFWNGTVGKLTERHRSLNNTLDNKNRRVNKLRVFKNQMVIATDKGLVYFENKNDLFTKARIEIDSISFNSAEFYPDSTKSIVVGTSNNGKVYIYDFDKEKQAPKILENHSDKVRDAVFSKDGQYLVSGSWDNSAIVWKTAFIEKEFDVKAIDTIKDSKSDIEDVAFNKDNTFALASSDNHVYLYDILSENDIVKRLPSFVAHRFPVRAIAFDDENYIYSIDKLGNLKKWDYLNVMKQINSRLEKD